MPDLSPGVPSALSPLVRRIVAPNPGPFTGPGTNTYLVCIDEVAVIDPGPDDKRHIDAIIGASMRERVRWVLLTHTHPDHAPGTARLVKATGAEVLAYGKRLDKDSTIVPDRVIGDGLEIFVRVRSTRAPQPAWLRAANGGFEVELVAGEEGVSPGQACVFYDAPSGQARVLGGGFIKSATARNAARGGAQETIAPQPFAEVARG